MRNCDAGFEIQICIKLWSAPRGQACQHIFFIRMFAGDELFNYFSHRNVV